eukprot:sb/3463637/
MSDSLAVVEINRGQNYFLRLSVILVEIVPSVFREAIRSLGPAKVNLSVESWLQSEPIARKLRQRNLNSSQLSLLSTTGLDGVDITLGSLLLIHVVKPHGGWGPGGLVEAVNHIRSIKNTVYSHTSKCWLRDSEYNDLERGLVESIGVVLGNSKIVFLPEFSEKILNWINRTGELISSRDDVLHSLQSDMKCHLTKIEQDQMILINKTDEQTSILRSLLDSQHTALDFVWEKLRQQSWRCYRNPIFSKITHILPPLATTGLTLPDLWVEIEVDGTGWLSGEVSLVFEKFLQSPLKVWSIEGGGGTGKTSFIRKMCMQAEVFYPQYLFLVIPDNDDIINDVTKDTDLVFSKLIRAGVLGVVDDIEREGTIQCLKRYSDNIVFFIDNPPTSQILSVLSKITGVKIVVTGLHRYQNRSRIVGLTPVSRDSLIATIVSSLVHNETGETSIKRQLGELRDFFTTPLSDQVVSLSGSPLFVQFVCVLYCVSRYKIQALTMFVSKRDKVEGVRRALLAQNDGNGTELVIELMLQYLDELNYSLLFCFCDLINEF